MFVMITSPSKQKNTRLIAKNQKFKKKIIMKTLTLMNRRQKKNNFIVGKKKTT